MRRKAGRATRHSGQARPPGCPIGHPHAVLPWGRAPPIDWPVPRRTEPGLAVEAIAADAQTLRPFVPRLAVDWVRTTPDAIWREVPGTLTFVDISGFTAMTERLARKGKVGAEEMNDVLNALFTELLSVAYRDGAGLVKWGGDAVLLLYEGPDHAERAARAAMMMQRTIRSAGLVHTSAGQARLRMSVGIHTGTFNFALVGDRSIHRELVIAGPDATRTTQMEQIAEAGEVVVSPQTAAHLERSVVGIPKDDGFLLCGVPDVPYLEAPTPDVTGIDIASFIPVKVREHLLRDDLEPEHRRIVASFIEFMGSDDMLRERGPAAVAAAIDECVQVVQRATARSGVSFFETDISKNAWKAFLIAGCPRSLGQDEDRMLATVREIVDTPLPFPLRIGVNAGPVFAAYFGPQFRKTYSVKGDAVNLAARLMGKAGTGEIFATASVLDPATGRFDLRALEPFNVKGKKLPIQAWSVGSRIGAKGDEVELPLVGREKEVLELRDAVERAREGEGSVIEIVGPAGMGKTRTASELTDAAADFDRLLALCEPYQAGTAYRPFRAILRHALDIPREASDDEAGARVAEAVARVAPELERWTPLIGIPFGVQIPPTPEVAELDERFRKPKLEEVVSAFVAALITRPTLFLIEDVHWMDDASADLLSLLSGRVRELPWVVCVTRRDEPTGFRVPDVPGARSLVLEPLPADAATRAIEAITDEFPLRPDQMLTLANRAGGNPLFLKELVGAYRDRGDEALPTSIEGLVTEEIDRLPLLERRVLRAAAVIGASVDAELLEPMIDHAGLGDVDWSVLGPFLVAEAPGRWRFRHALMRDAAYEGLPFRRRRELHAQVGEHLLEAAKTGPEDHAELLSLHFFRAQRYGEAWGFSRVAGDRASAQYANTEAVAFYRRAIDAASQVGVSPRERASMLEVLGDVWWRMGAFKEASSTYSDARRLIAGLSLVESGILYKQAKIPYMAGRYAQSVRWIRRGLSVLEGEEGRRAEEQRLGLLALLAAVRLDQGRLREAERVSRQVIEDARKRRMRKPLAHAYSLLDLVYSRQGRYERAVYLPRALAIHERTGDLFLQGEMVNLMGINDYYRGRWSEAIARYERSRELKQRVGDAEGAALADNNIAEILSDQGHLEEAETLFRDALRVFRASGSVMTGLALSNLGRVAARSGRFDEALELYERAEAQLTEIGDLGFLLENGARVAELHLFAGRFDRAIASARDVLSRLESVGGTPPQVPLVRRVLGYAFAAQGRIDEARAELSASVEAARETDASFELALTLRAMAEILDEDDLLSPGDSEDADRLLRSLGVEYVATGAAGAGRAPTAT
jgi:class 3 adenylate cyclase/tetratricopeptide (TPR) repeat protein